MLKRYITAILPHNEDLNIRIKELKQLLFIFLVLLPTKVQIIFHSLVEAWTWFIRVALFSMLSDG